MRGIGPRFFSSCAEFGAAAGIFFLPILKASGGVGATIMVMALVSLLGLVVTLAFQVETRAVAGGTRTLTMYCVDDCCRGELL